MNKQTHMKTETQILLHNICSIIDGGPMEHCNILFVRLPDVVTSLDEFFTPLKSTKPTRDRKMLFIFIRIDLIEHVYPHTKQVSAWTRDKKICIV